MLDQLALLLKMVPSEVLLPRFILL